MSEFRKHLQTAIYGYQPPKFLEAMDQRSGGKPVKMPHLWQVMVAPVLIMPYAALYVVQAYALLLGLSILALLAVALVAFWYSVPDDRGGWDDVDLP